MELINNNINNVFLLLAFSSVFFSAIAICVPLNINITDVESTAIPPLLEQTVSPQVAPDQSPPAVTTVSQPPEATSPQTSTSDQSSSNEISDEEDSGLLGLDYLHSDGLISTAASTVKTNLVEICDVTSNPQLCKTSISSHIEGTKVDPASALENFDMAIEDLKAGVESIDARDAGRMESVLTAVLTDLTTCDDTFAEMGVDSPLDNLSTKMSKYASNCLAISKLLL